MLVRAALLRTVCIMVVALMAICSAASADIIGPGNVDAGDRDGANPLTVIDTSKPVTLSAGQYKATGFSYQLSAGHVDTFQPFLATSNGDHSYTIIAVGDTVACDGAAASWQSHAFGGTDIFAGGTLYAGYYWQSPTIGTDADPVLCPIGYLNGSGSADVWIQSGAWIPAKGSATSVAQYVSLERAYDFSVTVTPVPEPCSLAMTIGLGMCLLAYAWRRWN